MRFALEHSRIDGIVVRRFYSVHSTPRTRNTTPLTRSLSLAPSFSSSLRFSSSLLSSRSFRFGRTSHVFPIFFTLLFCFFLKRLRLVLGPRRVFASICEYFLLRTYVTIILVNVPRGIDVPYSNLFAPILVIARPLKMRATRCLHSQWSGPNNFLRIPLPLPVRFGARTTTSVLGASTSNYRITILSSSSSLAGGGEERK